MKPRHRVQLRTVLFHEIADTGSTFTDGLGVRMPVEVFRSRIEFLTKHYTPVSGEDVRAALNGAELPPRALLITFDDAYASVADTAAEILADAAVPSIFFVNSGFIDHQMLGTDNLVAHVANIAGSASLQAAVSQVVPDLQADSIGVVLGEVIPILSLTDVDLLRESLTDAVAHDPLQSAADHGLYMTAEQLASLPSSVEIGSHTATHVRCRMLEPDEMEAEIDANRIVLQQRTSSPVRSFSVPYGSAQDLTPLVAGAVRDAGHDLTFLVEGQLNHGPLQADRLLRVSLHGTTNVRTSLEIELLPRLRYVRDLVKGRAS